MFFKKLVVFILVASYMVNMSLINIMGSTGEAIIDNLNNKEIEMFIENLPGLYGEKIKLVDENDPEAQLNLAGYFLDEDVYKYLDGSARFSNINDVLVYNNLNEKGEKVSECHVSGYKMFIIKDLQDKPVGKCCISINYFGNVNISGWVAKLFWSKGYACDVIKTVIKYFYDNEIKVPISIGADFSNTNSLHLLKKVLNELNFKDIDLNDLETKKFFTSSKYCLEQKPVIFKQEFKVDEEDSDLINITSYIFEQTVSQCQKNRKWVKPELIESGTLETKHVEFLLTPVY